MQDRTKQLANDNRLVTFILFSIMFFRDKVLFLNESTRVVSYCTDMSVSYIYVIVDFLID